MTPKMARASIVASSTQLRPSNFRSSGVIQREARANYKRGPIGRKMAISRSDEERLLERGERRIFLLLREKAREANDLMGGIYAERKYSAHLLVKAFWRR